MRDIKFAFLVQAFDFNDQLIQLLRWAASDGDLVFLSFDGEYDANSVPAGVQHHRSRPVSWGGYSQVAAYRDVLARALSQGDWSYAINLSESCLPLKSKADLSKFLSGFELKRQSFVGNVPTLQPDFAPTSSRWEAITYIEADMLRSRGVSILCDEGIKQNFVLMHESPVFNVQKRVEVYVEEIEYSKTLLIRRLTQSEAEFRKRVLSINPLRFGRAWICLHKSLCDQLEEIGNSSELIDVLKNSFEPDELFFQSLLCNSHLKNDIVGRNLHFRDGEPLVLTEALLEEALSSSDAFFVRKVDRDLAKKYWATHSERLDMP